MLRLLLLALLALGSCGPLLGPASDPARREAELACDAEGRRQAQGGSMQMRRGEVFREVYGACMRERGY
jgi:hypothetical protein